MALKEYSKRMCIDCVHCDIENHHNWCQKYNQRVPTLMPHPKERNCPYYTDIFDDAEKKARQRAVCERCEMRSWGSLVEELNALNKKESKKPKKKVRSVKDVWE